MGLMGSVWAAQSSKVAILTAHETRDVSYYQDLRQQLWEAWGLRLMRGLERWTGIALDGGDWTFRAVALGLLLLALTLIFTGFMARRNRRWCYPLASSFLFGFVFWIVLFGNLASLNQFDMKGAHRVQTVLDVTMAWGVPTELIWEWDRFESAWKGKDQPFSVVVWSGVPLGGEELQMESFIVAHRDDPILHVCLGANLPKTFHPVLFPGETPELDWAPDSPRSVTEKAAHLGRTALWQGKEQVRARIVPWGRNLILYARDDIRAEELSRWLEMAWEDLQDSAWARLDLSGIGALRLDDPGGPVGRYLEMWRFAPLGEARWRNLLSELEDMDSSLSVAWVPSWLDDGRGRLLLQGQEPSSRVAGQAHPSHRVRLEDEAVWDPAAISKLLGNSSRIDLGLHGSTHITPRVKDWLARKDRYENPDLYREFLSTEQLPFQQRDELVQKQLMSEGWQRFDEAFSRSPGFLTPPGHAISWNTAELATARGFAAMSDGSLAMASGNQTHRTRWIATHDVSAIPAEFHTPLTVMLHDRDFANEGVSFRELLEPWQDAGVKRWVSLSQLVDLLQVRPELKVDRGQSQVHLEVPSFTPISRRTVEARLLVDLPDGVDAHGSGVTRENDRWVVVFPTDGRARHLTWDLP